MAGIPLESLENVLFTEKQSKSANFGDQKFDYFVISSVYKQSIIDPRYSRLTFESSLRLSVPWREL